MKRIIAVFVVITALGVFVNTLTSALRGDVSVAANAGYESVTSSTVTYPQLFNSPARLFIPSIEVDAKVQHVGLTKEGRMGIPTNFTDVAWYKDGTIPGEVGSAVIDGHVDNALGLPGVFKKLKNINIGDDIYVTDMYGTRIHFIVRDIKEYPYDKAPAEEIFHEPERALLRLITCGGKWIRSAKTYDTRVVVTAEYIR